MTDGKSKTRRLLNELTIFHTGAFCDLGHPLLNHIADSFVKSAGIGALQAVSKDAYFTAVEGSPLDTTDVTSDVSSDKKKRFPGLSGETTRKSIEAMLKNTGKESIQWGLAAGLYSGLTHGLEEARGIHDWKNCALAGAITGMTLALTSDESSHEQLVQCAITGAAVSATANLLNGIF
ncbi:hypothetical protein ACFE04_004911 [Oxalis oulophora]